MSKRIRPVISYSKTRPSKTLPNQSLSIEEIVRRFVSGVPVDVVKRDPIYIDQNDDLGIYDYEAVSRMDFAEKAELAEAFMERAKSLRRTLKANERAQRDRELQRDKEAQQGATGSGIVSLDNTMPVDTTKSVK